MVARAVSDEERVAMLKVTLRHTATAVEAFIAAFEDGIEINRYSALEQLREIRGNIESVYVDLDPVVS